MISIQLEYDMEEKANIDVDCLKTVCHNILHDQNHNEGSITIIISDDEKLMQLKKKYFQENVLTDVIAFNLEEKGDPFEGEIYISLERVEKNAITYNQDFLMELKRVVIHGCLHVLGYDDHTTEEKKKMTHLENKYLSFIISRDHTK